MWWGCGLGVDDFDSSRVALLLWLGLTALKITIGDNLGKDFHYC